jgi:DNA-binding HxlR family transcriptional regulator
MRRAPLGGKRARAGGVGTKRCIFVSGRPGKIHREPPRRIGRMVEAIVRCKWSLTVLDLVGRGVTRPGAMERSTEGLSAKVLNECLRRLVAFRVLDRRAYPEIPPRVEYALTALGAGIRATLDALDALEPAFEDAARRSHGET